MSYDGMYTGFIALAGDHAPRILDWDAWEELKQKYEWLEKNAVLGEHSEGDYPKTEYKTLRGLNTYAKDYDYGSFRLSRIAYHYGGDFKNVFISLLAAVEPFSFYHSGHDSHWPGVDSDTFYKNEPPMNLGKIYFVKVTPDGIEMKRSQVKLTEWEDVNEIED